MEVRPMLAEFEDVSWEPEVPISRSVDHGIDLTPGSGPQVGPMFRMSLAELTELHAQLEDLLDKGLIEPSCSPFSAPVLFVRKKDSSMRMCLDYRELNTVKVRITRTPSRALMSCLTACTALPSFPSWTSARNIKKVRICTGEQHKTAIRMQYGHFQFRVMPFGLCNAPATFQRLMNEVFWRHLGRFVLVNLDDVTILSRSREEHLKYLRVVLTLLRQHMLFIKASKCEFARARITFLGLVVTLCCITMDGKKTAAIRNWPEPAGTVAQCKTGLRGFLGMASFHRRLIRNFAEIVAPLNDLACEQTPWF